MLAVVEDQQGLQVGNTVLQQPFSRLARYLRHAQSIHGGPSHSGWVGHLCKVDKPHSVAVLILTRRRDLDRQPGLAKLPYLL